MTLIKGAEKLVLIHVHNEHEKEFDPMDFIARFKGVMTKQPIDEVNQQLSKLRNAW
jgi:hypothetical protein